MKKFSLLNESNKLDISIDDVQDYFLELSDKGIVTFVSPYFVSRNIHILFSINMSLYPINKDNSYIITKITSICKRWNIDFALRIENPSRDDDDYDEDGEPINNNNIFPSLRIIIDAPNIILKFLDNLVNNNLNLYLNNKIYKFRPQIKLNQNLKFSITLILQLEKSNKFTNAKMSDDDKYFFNSDECLSQIENEIKKIGDFEIKSIQNIGSDKNRLMIIIDVL